MARERLELDVIADLNAEDADGPSWSTRSDARVAARVRVGSTATRWQRIGSRPQRRRGRRRSDPFLGPS